MTNVYGKRLGGSFSGLHKPVVLPVLLIVFASLICAVVISRTGGSQAFEALNSAVSGTIGWWYVLVTASFIVFALWAALSRVGKIRLGRDDEQPEFSKGSWFAMLFAAGMGIGLVFWGVAEPLSHFVAPPELTGQVGVDATGAVVLASESALTGSAVGITMFHWGLHAWAIYAVIGLGLAYMSFRRGRPLSVRWLLEPIFGRRLVESWLGHVIDILAVVGTIFGIVSSLGLGVQQIASGLGFLGWADSASQTLLVGLIVGIMAIAMVSAVSGVYKGLKWLSNINMVLAVILALFVTLAGPTVFILSSIIPNAGEYLQVFPQMLFETHSSYSGGEGNWSADWTVYYWGWWMSWSPFVGMFIARISRGRSIREFILGVLVAPTVVCLVWFTVFGSSGIWYQIRDGVMVGDDGAVGAQSSLFILLEQLPLSTVTSVLAILVIGIFFVTSADSGTLVTDVLAHRGATTTPAATRILWAIIIGGSTVALLLAAGEDAGAALRVLQISAIVAAAPFSVVLALGMVALVRVLRFERSNMPGHVNVKHASGSSEDGSPGGNRMEDPLGPYEAVGAEVRGVPTPGASSGNA